MQLLRIQRANILLIKIEWYKNTNKKIMILNIFLWNFVYVYIYTKSLDQWIIILFLDIWLLARFEAKLDFSPSEFTCT